MNIGRKGDFLMIQNKNQYTDAEKTIRRMNSLRFQISLWEKVKITLEDDGTKKVINAEYKDDPLFPIISVKGYNELNKQEEEYKLPCYAIIDDWSKNDWEEEFKRTGESPAFEFPLGVENLIFCEIANLKAELREIEEITNVSEKA